ncbi:MAG: CocE/NonD family hydrolase [Solirubrobacterales bacterium]|nr:CocE/NonD family hydrolase [Solirubrobacterales bacterium]
MAVAIAGLALVGGAMTTAVGAKPTHKKAHHKKKHHKKSHHKKKHHKKKAKYKKAPKITAAAPYTARGSVGDAYVKNAAPGSKLLLISRRNRIVRKLRADSYGSAIFYDVTPGATYTVRTPKGKRKFKKVKRGRKTFKKMIWKSRGTAKFRVMKPGENPPQSFYDGQALHKGLNYVTMRDGTELAMTVRLPLGKSMSDGPFPTFVEYSGYQTAAPHDSLTALVGGAAGGFIPSGVIPEGLIPEGLLPPGAPNPTVGDDPLAPATSTAVGSIIGPLLDFATVSVQMRGSGCSGGAFDLFGWPTTYDGYDAIETVAAQDWAQGHKVGMGGISFSGISQLFTAGTRPPHLSSVSPLSVTDDVYYGTGFPGGIFNSGFAYSWITERAHDAEPAPEGGQPWAREMSKNGDPDVAEPLREQQKQHCLANQTMRLQTRDYNKLIETNPYRTPRLFAKRSPGAWVKDINVPVFWVGAFQDEQTGGHWTEAVKNLSKSNKDVWVTMQNGVHVDSLGPKTITRWSEFMSLFTGNGRVPPVSPIMTAAGPVLYELLAESTALPIEPTRFALTPNTPANLAKAKATFRKDPRIRILMDNGAAIPGQPGSIGAKWEADFKDWPIPNLKPTGYYLGTDGKMSSAKPGTASSASYLSDPKARPARTLGANAQGDSWKAQPPYNWKPVVKNKGLGFITPAMTKDTFIAGPSSLDLYLKSNMPNTDLQATLTEVRPDGKETYVQNGWLRASHRKVDPSASTADDPIQTWLKEDGAPLKEGKFNLTRVQIFPVAHVFRAGSKIRINVQAPGGDWTIWDFDTIEKGKTTNTIGLGGATPSKLVLPVIPGQTAKGNPLPEPTALRGQPSRTFVPASNGG